jgi:hypothetical protein
MILVSTTQSDLRSSVFSLVQKTSNERPLKILDVGGGISGFLDQYVTHIIDINPREKDSRIVKGDICLPNVWDNFSDDYFDLTICTHTLEDIRDPSFVIKMINRISKSSFLIVPNKFYEFRNVERNSHFGASHHRWIFNLTDDHKLMATAKWPGLANERIIRSYIDKNSYLNGSKYLIYKKMLPRTKLSHLNFLTKFPAKTLELQLLSTGKLNFEYLNGDYCGNSGKDMVTNSLNFLNIPSCEIVPTENIFSAFYKYLLENNS